MGCGKEGSSLAVLSECGLVPKMWPDNECEEGPCPSQRTSTAVAREASGAAWRQPTRNHNQLPKTLPLPVQSDSLQKSSVMVPTWQLASKAPKGQDMAVDFRARSFAFNVISGTQDVSNLYLSERWIIC